MKLAGITQINNNQSIGQAYDPNYLSDDRCIDFKYSNDNSQISEIVGIAKGDNVLSWKFSTLEEQTTGQIKRGWKCPLGIDFSCNSYYKSLITETTHIPFIIQLRFFVNGIGPRFADTIFVYLPNIGDSYTFKTCGTISEDNIHNLPYGWSATITGYNVIIKHQYGDVTKSKILIDNVKHDIPLVSNFYINSAPFTDDTNTSGFFSKISSKKYSAGWILYIGGDDAKLHFSYNLTSDPTKVNDITFDRYIRSYTSQSISLRIDKLYNGDMEVLLIDGIDEDIVDVNNYTITQIKNKFHAIQSTKISRNNITLKCFGTTRNMYLGFPPAITDQTIQFDGSTYHKFQYSKYDSSSSKIIDNYAEQLKNIQYIPVFTNKIVIYGVKYDSTEKQYKQAKLHINLNQFVTGKTYDTVYSSSRGG